jgi:integrase
LQECLNHLAERGDSYSAVKKARTYINASLEYALDERLIASNPARRVELPSPRLRKPCGRFYSMEEVRRLLSAAAQESLREHLIVRLFVLCGLRAQELFALRLDDVELGIVRIDEALKETEKAAKRIGDTKNTTSNGYVATSQDLERELKLWIQLRNADDAYHRRVDPVSNAWLFPNEKGQPYRIGNYLKRTLKPIALQAGIPDMTYQALRRTFSTQFQRYGSPKDAQTQLRHSRLEMTGWYMRSIPEQVRSAVERMDGDLCKPEPETDGTSAIQ